ncbi:MAG: B12-binding domain-containing radical SAM protein [Thermodesulfovibrionales bacterium]
MRLRILLVNPWIYDFAAYNLWARPLGLLRVAEYLSGFEADISLIDCTDAGAPRRYGTGRFRAEEVEKPEALRSVGLRYKRYGIGIDDLARSIREQGAFDCVLMTSLMGYWYPGVVRATEVIREVLGDIPVVLGGIYATLYPEHALACSGADFIYRGGLSRNLVFALSTFGFRMKKKRKGGPLPYYRLGLYQHFPFAPLQLSTGCPCACPYCASALLAPVCERRPPLEVLREIGELYDIGVREYAFYDDALLLDADRSLVPLLEGVREKGLALNFHCPNGLHARCIDRKTARLMRETGFRTLRLSLETVNEERQRETGGKINCRDFERAVRLLQAEGFDKRELGAYLLYGLPGQEWGEVEEGVGFLQSLGVTVHLAEFSPIRGTRVWEELVRKGEIDDGIDPLLTNNSVFSALHSGYDPEKVKRTKLAVKEYNGR